MNESRDERELKDEKKHAIWGSYTKHRTTSAHVRRKQTQILEVYFVRFSIWKLIQILIIYSSFRKINKAENRRES